MSKKSPVLYMTLRPVASFGFRLIMRPKIYGRENIPKKGRAVVAGNHTKSLDCFMLMGATGRCQHFLAKHEIFKGPLKYFFSGAGLIPVDRSRKDKAALDSAIHYLNDDCLVAIFPEGKVNKTDEIILPLKIGAVKMARDTDSPIIPFTIKGKYKMSGKRPEIRFYPPYYLGDEDLMIENEKFREYLIEKMNCKGTD